MDAYKFIYIFELLNNIFTEKWISHMIVIKLLSMEHEETIKRIRNE